MIISVLLDSSLFFSDRMAFYTQEHCPSFREVNPSVNPFSNHGHSDKGRVGQRIRTYQLQTGVTQIAFDPAGGRYRSEVEIVDVRSQRSSHSISVSLIL